MSLKQVRDMGDRFVKSIVEPHNLAHTREVMGSYKRINDNREYFTFFQNIRNNPEVNYTWRLSLRSSLNESHYVTITVPVKELESSIKQSDEILAPIPLVEAYFDKLQLLTKREKEILSMIGCGTSALYKKYA